MDCRRQRWTARRKRTGRRARLLVETLERRFALDGTGQRPFIDLGASDNVALDQPRVTVEFGDASGGSIGPDIFNSWLLDTGANTILAFKTAIDDMNDAVELFTENYGKDARVQRENTRTAIMKRSETARVLSSAMVKSIA
jgi:hypothetical protein